MFGQQKCTGQVHTQHPVPLFQTQFLERFVDANARVVDDHINPREALQGADDQMFDLRFARDIITDRHQRSKRAQLAFDLLERFAVWVGNDHAHAQLEEMSGDGFANALCPTCDDHHFARRFHWFRIPKMTCSPLEGVFASQSDLVV